MAETNDIQHQAHTLTEFVEVWSSEYLLSDIGSSLTCIEADALSDLLVVFGSPKAAETLIIHHGLADDEGDDERHWLCPVCREELVLCEHQRPSGG